MVVYREGGATKALYTDSEGHVIHYNPSFTMDVSALGYLDADNSSSVNVGDTIGFAVLFTNTGNVTLTNIGVVDEDGIIGFQHGPVASLAPGNSDGSMTGTHLINSTVDTGIVNDEPIAQSDQFFNVLDIVNVDYGSLLALGPNGYIDAAENSRTAELLAS